MGSPVAQGERRNEGNIVKFHRADNSNVWIDGAHVAAFLNGLASNLHAAQQNDICDR